MKKITKTLALFMAVLAFTSCKEDANLPFNKLNEEENKELIENSAIEAARSVDGMIEEPAIDACVSLATHLLSADPLSAKIGQKSNLTTIIEAVASLKSENYEFYQVMKSVAKPVNLEEGPESIQDIWDMLVGTYTWNNAGSWDFSAEPTDKIVIIYPATPDGSTNNATLTIYDYEGVILATPIDEEYNGDLPSSLKWDLTINNDEVMAYSLAISYNEEGIPSKVNTELSMGSYVFAGEANNNDVEISESFDFKHSKDVILGLYGAYLGDFTEANIEANEETPENIVTSAEAKFRVYDVSVGFAADVKLMADSLEIIMQGEYATQQEAMDAGVAFINRAMNFYCIDEDSRRKIADVEAYIKETEDYGRVDYELAVRLEFGDGSQVDMETYMEEGFKNFFDEINIIIDDLNEKYNLGIDPIVY